MSDDRFSNLSMSSSHSHDSATARLHAMQSAHHDPPPAALPPPLYHDYSAEAGGQTLARRMAANDTTVDKRKCDGCAAHRPRARVTLHNGDVLYLCRPCLDKRRADDEALHRRRPAVNEPDLDDFVLTKNDHGEDVSTGCFGAMGRFAARWPCALVCGAFVPIVLMIFIATQYSFNLAVGGFSVKSHVTAEIQDARIVALDETYFSKASEFAQFEQVQLERVSPLHNALLFFETRDETATAFDVPNLQAIREVLVNITKLPGYEDHCVRAYGANDTYLGCSPPFSLVQWMYGEKVTLPNGKVFYKPYGVEGPADELVDEPEKILATLYENGLDTMIDQQVSKDFQRLWYKSQVVQVILSFGGPYKDFKNNEDRRDDQRVIFEDWALEHLGPLLANATENNDKLNLAFVGDGVTDILAIVNQDAMFAVGAILLVYFLIYVHTRSFFLASLGMGHIMLSFPTAYFLFRVVIGQKEVDMMLVLSLFIVLGIGADDIFIFYDTFAQSRVAGPEISGSLATRIAYTWKHAASSITITSLSTGAAFFVNGFSIVPPIRTFGLFTGFLVFMNYVLCSSMFVGTLSLYAKWFENKTCCGCLSGKDRDDDDDDDDDIDDELRQSAMAALPRDTDDIEMGHLSAASTSRSQGTLGVSKAARAAKFGSAETGTRRRKPAAGQNGAGQGTLARMKAALPLRERETLDVSQHRAIEQFFYSTFVPFMDRWKVFIVGLFALASVVAATQALQLAPATEPAVFLPPEHPLQRTGVLQDTVMKGNDNPVQVFFMLGLDPIDRTDTDPNNSTDYGVEPYNAAFDFGSEADQLAMLELCDQVAQVSTVRREEVLCPIRELASFLERRNRTDEPRVPIPGGSAEVAKWFAEMSECRDVSCGDRGFQVLGSSELVRFARIDRPKALRGGRAFAKGDLLYLSVVVNTTMLEFVPSKVGQPLYEEYEDIAVEWNGQHANMQLVQHSRVWPGIVMDRTLQTTAVQGVFLSLLLASIILLIATHNWIITLMSVVSIGGIVCAFLGFIVTIGWTLGIIESIAITVLVGLSVDFVAHLAISYNKSHFTTRLGRVRTAMLELGVSVASAALTTIAAASLLMAAQVTFFSIFGTFILLAILFSALYAFLFFVALVLWLGPQNDQGDLLALWRSFSD